MYRAVHLHRIVLRSDPAESGPMEASTNGKPPVSILTTRGLPAIQSLEWGFYGCSCLTKLSRGRPEPLERTAWRDSTGTA